MGGQEVHAFEVALDLGPFVYRLGRHPFTVQRGVRFPYGLSVEGWITGLDAEFRAQARSAAARNDQQQVVGWYVCGGRSSVWLEHSTVTREVAGSSPVVPVKDSTVQAI